MKLEKSAGAVIFRRSANNSIEFFLLQHSQDYWNFPKGKLEPGETKEMAAKREIKEETGLDIVNFIPRFAFHQYYFFRAPERNFEMVFKRATYFLAEVGETVIKISHEHQAYKWLPLHQALERTAHFPVLQKMIVKAYDFILKKV
jgi:bis(5'-nucleosidyl)-tetraphosphatase